MKYLKVDIFNHIITLYFLILLPFGKIFNNYFKKVSKDPNIKNIFFNIGLYLFLASIIIGYFLIGYSHIFLILLFFIFLLSFKINIYSSFIYGIILFIGFIFSYFLKSSVYIYSSYLFFTLGLFIIGILSYLFEDLIKKLSGEYFNIFINILAFLFICFFTLGFYNIEISKYFILAITSILFIYNIGDYKSENIFKNDFKKDVIVVSFYFITIIPIINEFMYLENKNIILLITSGLFLTFYIIYNLTLKRVKSLNQL